VSVLSIEIKGKKGRLIPCAFWPLRVNLIFFVFCEGVLCVKECLTTLPNLATATATDHGMLATLTEVIARIARQLEERSKEVKEVKALLKKEHAERRGHTPCTPSSENYCWSHDYNVAKSHTSQTCNFPKDGHKREAKKANNMGGCQAKK
jgi:hypothetical protein